MTDKNDLMILAAAERGECTTLRSARKCPTIPTACPLCEVQLPSKNQLRKHGKTDHGIKCEDLIALLIK